MLSTFITALPIFLIILLGKFLNLYFFKNIDFWRGAEKITYYVLFPALLINALIETNFQNIHHISKAIIALVIATLLLAGILILIQFLMKTDRRTFTSYFQGAIRYNSYIFIGLAAVFYGSKSIAIVAIVIAYMIILTNALSVFILDVYISGNKTNAMKIIKNMLKNPLIIAPIVGIFLHLFQRYIPMMITNFLSYVGSAALPLSLLCVGAGLKFEHLYNKRFQMLAVNIAKLIILPIFSIGILSLFKVSGLPREIAILYSAVPCAGNAYILAQLMGGDADTMAAIISTSVLLSMITIPLIINFSNVML